MFDKVNEILIKYPKASALIPIAAILVVYTFLTSVSVVLHALALSALIIAILLLIVAIKDDSDIDDDDWWSPGGPRPV